MRARELRSGMSAFLGADTGLGPVYFGLTYAPQGWDYQGRENRRKGDAEFGIYWMDLDGRRIDKLLAKRL